MMISRRSLLTTLGVLCGGLAVRSSHLLTRRYGPVTIERHRHYQRLGIHLHVYHRGEDVTLRCRYADDTGAGHAELLRHDADGKKYKDYATGQPAMETVSGVTIRAGAPLS